MSILREDGEIELECDATNCTRALGKAFQSDEFEEMISYAKRKRWQITKEGGKFVHYCPDHL